MANHEELVQWSWTLDANEVAALSTRHELIGQERRFIYEVARKLRHRDSLSLGQLQWLRKIMEKIDTIEHLDYRPEQDLVKPAPSRDLCDVRHLTVRLAWHDSAWNGRICEDPV